MATLTKQKTKKVKESKASSAKSNVTEIVKKSIAKKDTILEQKKVVKVKKESILKTQLNTDKKSTKKEKNVTIDKIKVEEITDADLVGYSLDKMLTITYGKKGTIERDSAELRIKQYEINLINNAKEKTKLENEPVTELKSTVTEKQIEATLKPKGILPADYVPETTSNINTELAVIPPISKPINTQKEFNISKDASFLGGDIKTTVDNTKVVRLTELDYMIYGDIGQPTSFSVPFKSIDLADAENFWNELIQYESEQLKKAPVTEEEKEKVINKFEGLPLTEVNIKELINVAPSSPVEEIVKKTLGKPADISHILNNQTITQMESYSDTIVGIIHSRPWIKMSANEVNKLISTQVSKEYTYELKNDGIGYYINITKGNTVVRCPKDVNAFLNMS